MHSLCLVHDETNLNKLSQHDNDVCLALPDHAPEVSESDIHGSLRRNVCTLLLVAGERERERERDERERRERERERRITREKYKEDYSKKKKHKKSGDETQAKEQQNVLENKKEEGRKEKERTNPSMREALM